MFRAFSIEVVMKLWIIPYNAALNVAFLFLSCFQKSAGGNDEPYYLVTKDVNCHVGSSLKQPLDLVCQHYDKGPPGGRNKLCKLESIQWQRLTARGVYNISDSYKYGVWGSVLGWGTAPDEHISLMRIRDVAVEDIGTYRCHISCHDRRGRLQHIYHFADVCLGRQDSSETICSSQPAPTECSENFRDEVCLFECDTERHLYDGFDCYGIQDQSCKEPYANYCAGRFANGICDESCNTGPCYWDGGDCISPRSIKFAEDTLVLFISDWQESEGLTQAVDLKELGFSLSKLLRTIVRILPDEVEDGLATPRNNGANRQSDHTRRGRDISDMLNDATRRIRIKIDNTHCKEGCFKTAYNAARFIKASLQKGLWKPGVDIYAVTVLSRDDSRCQLENNTLLHIDLSSVDRSKSTYNQGGLSFWPGDWQWNTWMIVVVAAGIICFIVVLSTIFVIVCHLRATSKLRKRQLEQARHTMQSEKPLLRGTHV